MSRKEFALQAGVASSRAAGAAVSAMSTATSGSAEARIERVVG
jgi:hypothetical protein